MKNMARRKNTWRKPKTRKPPKKTQRQIKIENAILEWPSLSEGLTPQQKLALARSIRGSGKLPTGMNHLYRPVTEDDLRSLALHCCRAIIERKGKRTDRVFTDIILPYSFRYSWPKFPIGVMIDADMLTITMRYNCNKILDFLHQQGYSDFSSRDLRKYLGTLQRKLTGVDEDSDLAILNAYGYDSEIMSMYEDIMSDIVEGESNE